MAKKKESFESMMTRLDEIEKKLENNDIILDDAIRNYEEGISLCGRLYKLINNYEAKIKILKDDKEEDFNVKEE